MDIYSAQMYAEKLLRFLKEIQTTSPPVYANSKRRYRKLAESCQEVIYAVSAILKEDHLNREDMDSEFDEPEDDKLLLSRISSMENELSSLKSFLSKGSDSKPIPTSSKKEILKRYAKCLQRGSYVGYKYHEMNVLSKLLWTWFDARFFQSLKVDTQFRYQISRIPEWIAGIVLAYSVRFEAGESSQFVSEFESWCKTLVDGSSKVKYCVPYSVYSYMKLCPKVPLVGVVLWDMLCSNLFVSLCQDPKLIEEDQMFHLCSERSPDELDRYKNYTIHPEIAEECGLHISEGGDLI